MIEFRYSEDEVASGIAAPLCRHWNRVAPVAEAPASLNWRVTPAPFQELRAHPAVAGTQIEARRPELKEVRRWGRKG